MALDDRTEIVAKPTAAASRRPSMDDVARAAGVSKAAVSKVIRNAYGVSPQMRENVEATIKKLGYRPRIAARAMRGSSFTIGFEIPNLGNEFFTQVMRGAVAGLEGSNYQLMIAPGLGLMSGGPVLENLVDRQVDGIVAISPEVAPEWLETLAAQVPIVLIGRHDHPKNYDTVTNDDDDGSRQVMDHLHELGHRHIAHVTTRMEERHPGARPPHSIRLDVYRQKMQGSGVSPIVTFCDASEAAAHHAALKLLHENQAISAIFAGNDTLAFGAQRAVAELGLSPEQVSVVGYDDVDMASHPLISLTTVSQLGEEIGRSAIELLMERIIDGRTEPRHRELHPRLKIRTSSGPPSPRATEGQTHLTALQ